MDKKSLVTLANEAADIERMLIESDGELTPEVEAKLTVSELQLPQKVENYSQILQRVELMSEHYKKQAQFFNKLAKTCDNFELALKENIKTAMTLLGVSEIEGVSVTYKLTASNPKLIIDNPEELPAEYKKQVIETVIDNKTLKDHLVTGLPVKGAHIEPTVSLRKYGKKL